MRANDAEAAIAFYKQAFGAVEEFRLVEPGGRIGHAQLLFGSATIMISDEFPEFGIRALSPDSYGACLIHLHVDDADAAVSRAVAAGAHVTRPVVDEFYGERGGTVRDPFGYDWMLGYQIEEVSPEEMQRRYGDLLSKS